MACLAQKVLSSDTKPSWELDSSVVPQGLILGLIVFNAFFSNLDSRMECTLDKFVGDSQLVCVVSILEGRAVVQRDPNRLKK